MGNVKKQRVRAQTKYRVRSFRKISKRLQNQHINIQNLIQSQQRNYQPEFANQLDENVSLSDRLCSWSQRHNITQSALSDLLKILVSIGLNWLPTDARTLVRTPRNIQVDIVANGKMWYQGIETNLRRIFHNLSRSIEIHLNFNIDGLPLFKSSRYEFWPILANINGTWRFSL